MTTPDTKTLAERLRAQGRVLTTWTVCALCRDAADRLEALSSSLDQQITVNAEQAEEISGLRAQVACDRDTIADLVADKVALEKRIADLEKPKTCHCGSSKPLMNVSQGGIPLEKCQDCGAFS